MDRLVDLLLHLTLEMDEKVVACLL